MYFFQRKVVMILNPSLPYAAIISLLVSFFLRISVKVLTGFIIDGAFPVLLAANRFSYCTAPCYVTGKHAFSFVSFVLFCLL